MILGRDKLKERLCLPTDNVKALVITPLLDPDSAISEDSIDLRLGTDFSLTRSDRLAVNVPGHARGGQFQKPLHVPLGRYLVLPGHHTVLASTLEYIKLPPDLSAMVLTKSSWARTFITIETAPWVHPCYRGCLTLEIANVSETPITLYPGLHVAQLVVLEVTHRGRLRDQPSAPYLGTVRPEPPNFDPPKKILCEGLGIDERYFRLPKVSDTATDRAIDELVYRLYGLTHEEIQLIEEEVAKLEKRQPPAD